MTEPSAPARRNVRDVARILAVALAYFAAARFGQSLSFSLQQVTAIWPPTGIAVAALLLWGYRVWPGIYLGTVSSQVLVDGSLLVPALVGVGNTLGPVVARLWLGRVGFDRALASTRDIFHLSFFGAALGMAVPASCGVAILASTGIIPWSAYGSIWWIWWVGDAMGVLVFATLILSWATHPHLAWSGSRLAELCAIFGGLILVSLIALAGAFFHNSIPFQLQYAIFPLIIWVSLRFGIRETTTAIAFVIGFAIWGATHDRGPFTTGNLDQRLILLEMFTATATVTGYLLSAISSERTRARQELQRAYFELEDRIEQRTAELATANAVLAQSNEEVEAFIYIVSHDLRVPLVNIQGFSKELERSCRELEGIIQAMPSPAYSEKIRSIFDDDLAGALRYISASTNKFQRLIDALLLLSRTGKYELRHEVIDLRALVDTTILSLRQSIEHSGAELVIDPLPTVTGDVTAIGQVFSNLISNALKYLQPGRPGRIRIGGALEDGVVHCRVSDNGAGIPASSQPRLFQVFQRFHPELAPGEGMGLAIVKRLVERHGGKVWAESEQGVGTTFHVTLPAPGDTRKE